MSTQYIIELKKDVERGMNQKLNSGNIVTRAPLGYKNNKLTKKAEIDEEKAHYIRRIFELRCDNRSLELIKDIVNEEGFRSYKGNKIGKSTIERIIKNPFYYGAMTFRGEIYEGNHKPLIKKELWDIANGIGKSSVNYTKHLDHPMFALKGIVKHLETGTPLTVSFAKKKYVYYHIHGESKIKERMYINQNVILNYFDSNIGNYNIPESLKDVITDGFKVYFETKIKGYDTEKKLLKTKIADLKKKKKSLLNLRASGELDKDEYLESKNEVMDEEAGLKSRLEELSKSNDKVLAKLKKSVELLVNLNDKRKTLDTSEKLQFIKSIAVELNFDNKKRLHIAEKPLFKIIRNQNFENW